MGSWIIWAVLLIAQNFAFTFVSRARNSGSLKRHLIAGIGSNGIWFLSQIIIFTKMFAMMTGKYGVQMAVFTGLFYTAFTLLGSVLAHYFSLKTEKGKSAVGATSKYAQIPVEEWNKVKTDVLTINTMPPDKIATLLEMAAQEQERVMLAEAEKARKYHLKATENGIEVDFTRPAGYNVCWDCGEKDCTIDHEATPLEVTEVENG